MVFAWDEAESFRRHSEAMKRFRRLHGGAYAGGGQENGFKVIRLHLLSIPVPAGVSGGIPGQPVRMPVIPLWGVEIAGGSQN